jgi:uncharacterized protein YndB with AHSA1/START domain
MPRPRPALVALGIAVAAIGAGAAAYAAVRPWQLTWGARPGEVTAPMRGDELVPRPQLALTRAITIAAPPEAVWPWLVQMGGYTRAGWYSYDRIDNAGRPSADRIVPELQQLAVGDVLPTGRDGTGFEVVAIDPPRSLVAVIDHPQATTSWAMTLTPDPAGSRLVFRLRLRAAPTLTGWLYRVAMDAGDFVMMRRQLLGIRDRAEGRR